MPPREYDTSEETDHRRELAETRFPATTHHMLIITVKWPAPCEEVKPEWYLAKCKMDQPTVFRKAAREKVEEGLLSAREV